MPQFRKKPVVVEAVRLTRDDFATARDFIPDGQFAGGGEGPDGRVWLKIGTLEGVMRADEGDWIIRGVQGEFYPCKPDIFEETYEPVTRTAPPRAFLGESPCGNPACECHA